MREVALVFFKLGWVAFGGPAAHIAMMEDEFVQRRRWLDREHFLDLVGLTQLIPGPNSTEMVIHLGYLRAGWRGLWVAGVAFLVPAILLTLGLAWLYEAYGSVPAVGSLLKGVQPVVVAVLLLVGWRLGKRAAQGPVLALLAIAVCAAVLLGAAPLWALLGGTLLGTLVLSRPRPGELKAVDLLLLGLIFLKVGSILYGSGYVLIAFLEDDLVLRQQWLTQATLVDSVAAGQLTPGPVLATSTFIGYHLAGLPGAAVATAGIFLPSFVFVALLGPVVKRLRNAPAARAFLSAVRASAVGLLAAVVVLLAKTTLDAPAPIAIAVVAFALGFRFKVAVPWLLGGGALAGLAMGALS